MDTKEQPDSGSLASRQADPLSISEPGKFKKVLLVFLFFAAVFVLLWLVLKNQTSSNSQENINTGKNPATSQKANSASDRQGYINSATQTLSKVVIPQIQSTSQISEVDLPKALAEYITSGAVGVSVFTAAYEGGAQGYKINYETSRTMAEEDLVLKNILASNDASQKWEVVNYTRSNKANMIEKSSQNFAMRIWLYPDGNITKVSMEILNK